MKVIHRQTNSYCSVKSLNLTNLHPSIRTNYTIQNYINKKLTTMNSSTKLRNSLNVQPKTNGCKKSKSSGLLIKPKEKKEKKLNFSNLSSSTNSHDFYNSFTNYIPYDNNEIIRIKEENMRLQKELSLAQKRIKELEKKLSEYLVDNTPIEKTQCPKPMPYVNKCEGRSFNTGKSHHIGRVYSQWDLKGEFNDSIQELTLTESTAN